MKSMSLKEKYEDFNKTFGNESPSYSMVKKWVAEFRRESLEDYDQSRDPKEANTDETIELVHNLTMGDRRSLCDIAG